jgi:PAP2 superfamily
MRAYSIVSSPAFVGMLLLFLSVLWMLKNPKDAARPILVFALVFNLFYCILLNFFMGSEGNLLPWKYDRVLFNIDGSLGFSAAAFSRWSLEHGCLLPLVIIYQLMVPMMICWFFVTHHRNLRASFVCAYIVELVGGPILYSIVPACGPIYAFGAQWLHPPVVQPGPIQLTGSPNAFPSLHVGTALVLVLFAPGKFSRGVSLAFLVGTVFATIATGEHYGIDLVAGLAFGCCAVSVGRNSLSRAALFLAITLTWSLLVRFAYILLIAHPAMTASFATLTVALATVTVLQELIIPRLQTPEMAMAPQE